MEKNSNEFDAFVFPVLALVVGLILDEVNKRVKFLGIPDSVLQFLVAMCTSITINKFLPTINAHYIANKYSWTSLNPKTIMMVFLFISIIVATDPVAVVSILEQYGAPHRLRILIEGESLLNDGLALTTYRIFVDILKVEMGINEQIFFEQEVFKLFMCVFVSPLMGCLGANIVSWIVKRLRENKKRQAFILVSVYGMFMICDTCNASPALGLVTFGVVLSSYRFLFLPIKII
uniref:Na_H_Exchanger domain-containing protein n=1 Tax=Heterorhabditis bacteriophora TaxID=37862 RepID=A0A1I7X605_HETBA